MGWRIDHYEVQRVLGEGGMGTVYLARDTMLKRQVALKVIRPLGNKAELIQRFARETRLAAQLTNVHVARVYGGGESQNRRYLVMEFVDGIDWHPRYPVP